MKLFEPGYIGNLAVKNRIVMSPILGTGLIEPDGRLSERGIHYYIARAKGGAGLIIAGGVHVSRELEGPLGTPWFQYLLADSDMYLDRLNQLVLSVHDYDAKIAFQLTAGFGRYAPPDLLRQRRAVAPSVLPCAQDTNLMTRELRTDEIEGLVKAFQFAAERLVSTEVDAIEINAHSGYLIDQFLTSLWNKRTDKYGGDLNGRLRFLSEIIEAVKKGAGEGFPIICRISINHYLKGGRETDEGIELARRLGRMGIDALDISAGCFESREWRFPTIYMPQGYIVNLGEMVKKSVNLPVILTGKLGYPDLAEKVIKEGKADFIALGRPLLADPEWPDKVKEGRLEDIRPCIGNNEGCIGRSRRFKYLSCEVNPMTGMEREYSIRPAEKERKVLIIGGGPSGLEAARVAALRGHGVTLWEKNGVLGGNLVPASIPDFKQDHRRLIEYLSCQVRKLGVAVVLGKEATPETVQEFEADAVLIGTGSTPVIPVIPGVKNAHVFTAIDLLLGKKPIGKSVLILGGNAVGCETALYLAEKHTKVAIVEIMDQVARDVNETSRPHLLKLLRDVNVLVNTNVIEIREKSVAALDKDGKTRILNVDTVIIAVGLKSERVLAESLEGKVRNIYTMGDCIRPRRVMNAIWDGFRIARLL